MGEKKKLAKVPKKAAKKVSKPAKVIAKAAPKPVPVPKKAELKKVEPKKVEPKKVEPKIAAPAKKTSKKAEPPQVLEDGKADEQWLQLYGLHKSEKAVPYSMSATFEPKTAILHKVLGWGYVLKSHNNRIEVVFKDGLKILITNYGG